MSHQLRSDPFVAAEIEAAVAPFVGRIPAGDIEWMREQLALILRDDPAARAALDGAHPRAEVDESGERARILGSRDGCEGKQQVG